MDFYTTIWLTGGMIIGICIGWGGHALFTRWYLKKHMKNHPEFKIYRDILNGALGEKQKSK